MRLVFMGTPEFATPSLQALYDAGQEIAGVFTQPDRPAGRGNKLKASPVKILAESLNLPVFQPMRIKTPEVVDFLKELQPECIVVVAFGQILSKEILNIPRYGCINVHASLLPEYRGAAPIHWSVINGEEKTGITTMLMDEGLDTGDILLQEEYVITQEATTGEVHDALSLMGAKILVCTINGMTNKTIIAKPQPLEFTYAPLLKRAHEQMDWSLNANMIHNKIRGLNPWPGAFAFFRGEQIKVWKSRLLTDANGFKKDRRKPGEIITLTENGLIVQTGAGYLQVIELQPAGKKRMTAKAFYNGHRIKDGEFFI